ncbi:MAG TPA: glycoside hydrolase family 30 protein [Anaerolineales bacterium]|nr:glycoside hydrolase family 30 protein [Anaerolineales bacterium]
MKQVHVVQTAKNTGDRLTQKEVLALQGGPVHAPHSVSIEPSQCFQTIEGFGGAFTESAAVTLYKLSPEKRTEVLRAYFDPIDGHGYTLCRTHIGSCDFSAGNYAYDEVEGDHDLQHFSIDRDRRALIPMIHEAFQVAGGPIKLLASPWSPPAWMKTNDKMIHGGKLRPDCRETWAKYYCRYVREYERENIPIWGLSVQNEVEATQTWESCLYSPEEERDFVRDYLGPTLRREGLIDIKLLIFDHNRDHIVNHARVIYEDPAAAQYVWGTAFHWYVGDWFDNVQKLHDVYPEKHLLFTEGCQEGGPHLGEWGLGERYARSMINDLNRWTVGWIDWNLLLDETGGPNHVGNYCSAPLMIDTRSCEILYQSSYYYIGHFSRYIRPGAQRIGCASDSGALETTAFINPDSQIAVVVLNRTSQPVPYALQFEGLSASLESQPNSIVTLLLS